VAAPGPTNESWQTLTFSLTNTQPALFAVQPTVDVSGTLRYTPAANVNVGCIRDCRPTM